MKRKPLPGVIAVVLSPEDTAAACEAAKERVIRAAVAYAAAWRAWETREEYAPKARQFLHRAQAELVAAVEAMHRRATEVT